MRRAGHSRSLAALAFALALLAHPCLALGLERYGRPLPSKATAGDQSAEAQEEEGGEKEDPHALRGFLLTGPFVVNHNYFARPDNTGLVGLRHMVHLDMGIYKELLRFHTDQNFFSDKTRNWITLSEWDTVFGFNGTLDQWWWRIQYERDAPLDRSGLQSKYADMAVTYTLRPINQWSWWRDHLPNQNLTAYLGPGWLFYNENYFARPDNTGRALFRYIAHTDLDLYRGVVVAFADTVFWTDRLSDNPMKPSELDWMWGLAFRLGDTELLVYYEEDMPLDGGGLTQRYTATQLRYQFEWKPPRFALK